MGEPIRIDYASTSDVASATELAEMTRSGRHVVIQFASLPRREKDELIDRLAKALPDHSVFYSGGGNGREWVTVKRVIDRSIVLAHRYAILRSIVRYRRACKTLMKEYRTGNLSSEWQAARHGGHCRFSSSVTGQVVEAPLHDSVGTERIDPYFFALFVCSTAGLEAVGELLKDGYHDAGRVLDIIAGSLPPSDGDAI